MRKNNKVVMMGDGQVSIGSQIVKNNAEKIRRIGKGEKAVLAGFAGSTADAVTMFEALEKRIHQGAGNFERTCTELGRQWRTGRGGGEAFLLVANAQSTLLLTGNGDVLRPEYDVMGIGSGGNYAYAAALALLKGELDAEKIAEEAMRVAGQLCVYTNDRTVKVVLET